MSGQADEENDCCTSYRGEIEILEIALCESLVLQSHYATLLNRFDDGNRMTFATAKD